MQASSFVASIGLAVTLAFASGCGGSAQQPPSSPERTMSMRTNLGTDDATLVGDRLYGAEFEVSKVGSDYRGRAFGAQIDLKLGDGTLVGFARDRTDLHFEDRPDGLVLRGIYAGKLGELVINNEMIRGRVGGCDYDLRSADGATYNGMRHCVRTNPVKLTIPPAVSSLPVPERAAMFAIFLGR
jgi:hypothetical protein